MVEVGRRSGSAVYVCLKGAQGVPPCGLRPCHGVCPALSVFFPCRILAFGLTHSRAAKLPAGHHKRVLAQILVNAACP